jgi:hypothetical protein
MALLNQYVQTYAQIPSFFERLRQGQAPEKFTRQYLKDLGFKSSNHHALIPLLKGLGFLSADGSPTQVYKDYLDASRSKKVLGHALRTAYSDIFTIKAKPSQQDKALIEGKFRSTYNVSENVASLQANTFLNLLKIADIENDSDKLEVVAPEVAATAKKEPLAEHVAGKPQGQPLELHYTIQIHLPPTKEIDVYNAIFKALREHLLD